MIGRCQESPWFARRSQIGRNAVPEGSKCGWGGFEPELRAFSNLLMVRDFWSKMMPRKQLWRLSESSPIPASTPQSSRALEKCWRQPFQVTCLVSSDHSLLENGAR